MYNETVSSPLYIRSVYTLLSSLCDINKAVEKCKEYGYTSAALTDKNVLSGSFAFYRACEKAGIHPLFGLECDVEAGERVYSILLMAKDDEGYKNLMGLSSHISTGEKKTIDIATLNHYRPNNYLILFSDDMPLTYAIDKNLDVPEYMERQEDYFGRDYLVAMADHNIAINRLRDEKLRPLLKLRGIKMLALSRTYFPDKDDFEAYEVLKCIRDKKTINDVSSSLEEGRYLFSPEEFEEYYTKEELLNTDVLASRCQVKLEFSTSLPKYECRNSLSSKDYLQALCIEGLKRRRKGKVTKEYSDRLKYELDVILRMHFEDYFLIVYDFILYAKKNGILVGPGRGSAAGSLVSYCLGITEIDPIRFGLLFERFLNPERITMPDIDTDFPDDKRDQVIAYVRDKYGKDHVAHILTFGTLKAKQVLRDVGRVLNYSTGELDALCKLVPFAPDATLKKTYDTVPLFAQRVESEEKYRRLYSLARKLEGQPRHESTHAAGIVLSSKPLSEVVPLIAVESDVYSTQYTMEYLEDLGLIKMDFLAIRNLSIIAEIVEEINKIEPFDIHHIPLDDPKTFSLISSVNTLGIFQLESSGMKSLVKKMRPRNFEEIGITIALFRPGPMENIPAFLENRAHPQDIRYLHEDLKDILEETYGIIVYQEQIMNIARKMASFSYGKADVLRRAMSKKKASELEGLKDEFIEGCLKNGYDREVSENIYELILKFANYGFNKSHSIVYGMVAYQMAYLKANYPLYFYKALLNGCVGSESKTYDYISECRGIGQKVLGVSVNSSSSAYEIADGGIRMPLNIIKDVGSISASRILEERREHGPYRDYIDAVKRMVFKGIDKNVIENLIYAGAMDGFGYGRNTMLKALPNVLRYASAHKGEISIMNDLDDAPMIEEFPDNKMVLAEKERSVLGFYFTYDPITEVKKEHGISVPPLREIGTIGSYVRGFGLIKRVKKITTKKKEPMAFADISDESGDLSLAVMPNIFREYGKDLEEGKYVYFEGKIERESSCLVRKMTLY